MATGNPIAAYARRDTAILHHVGLYGVGLTTTVGELFFKPTGNGGHVLKRLAEEGFLELFQRALPGGISYCRLSSRGCAAVQAPKERSEPLGPSALDQAIAISYWCCLAGPARRYRVESKEVRELWK